MRKTPRCYVLVIRITASLTLIVVWIICSPFRFAGRGFSLHLTALHYRNERHHVNGVIAAILGPNLLFEAARKGW
jgi:hypothetical protein